MHIHEIIDAFVELLFPCLIQVCLKIQSIFMYDKESKFKEMFFSVRMLMMWLYEDLNSNLSSVLSSYVSYYKCIA